MTMFLPDKTWRKAAGPEFILAQSKPDNREQNVTLPLVCHAGSSQWARQERLRSPSRRQSLCPLQSFQFGNPGTELETKDIFIKTTPQPSHLKMDFINMTNTECNFVLYLGCLRVSPTGTLPQRWASHVPGAGRSVFWTCPKFSAQHPASRPSSRPPRLDAGRNERDRSHGREQAQASTFRLIIFKLNPKSLS